MDIKQLQRNWNAFGKSDPFWAVLTSPSKKGNKWQVEEFFKTGKDEIEEVMKYVKSLESLNINIKKRKALDFGCGVGRLTQALADYFDEVCGVDIAQSMIELAEKYNSHGNRCKYYINDDINLKLFANSSFDLIYTNIVLQHIEPKYSKNYIREFIRILVPDGLLIFQIPSERIRSKKIIRKLIRYVIPLGFLDWIFYFRINLKSMFYKEPRMEMYAIRQEEIIDILKENGAKVVDIKRDQYDSSSWVSLRYCVTK